MALFEIKNNKILATKLKGRRLIQTPRLNKGSAFSKKERIIFGLAGLLPNRQETLLEQSDRLYKCYKKLSSNIDKHVFLGQIRNDNETLFYFIVQKYFSEMLPIIYTPTISEAVQQFSKINLQARGLFIAYPDRKDLKKLIAPYKNYPIKVAIITDGEGVLGIGDQGVGGINIAIAKGNLYALIAGFDPSEILPIQLDAGTNNTKLRQNSNYLGWQHERITGTEYHKFVDKVINNILSHFPNCFIHWEDLARDNAQYFLKKYQSTCCTFNDDIQGTGAVALATILTALSKKKQCLTEQNIIIYGAGSAGIGIADQIVLGMQAIGLNSGKQRIWLIDRCGVLCFDSPLNEAQKPYAKAREPWMETNDILLECIKQTKATILIGCSAQTGHFTKQCITSMLQNDANPIIMPLSNPTIKAEATPEDIINWTKGAAYIATGSPFPPVEFNNKVYKISQCNNMFIFPGLGRAAAISGAKSLSPSMVMSACQALAKFTHKNAEHTQLLPDINQCKAANKAITEAIVANNNSPIWQPKYLPYTHKDEEHE